GSGSHAERARRLERRLAQLRMRRQTEVVVRGEVDDGALVEGGVSFLLTVEHPQAAVQALRLEGVELLREIAKRVGAHRAIFSEKQDERPRQNSRRDVEGGEQRDRAVRPAKVQA